MTPRRAQDGTIISDAVYNAIRGVDAPFANHSTQPGNQPLFWKGHGDTIPLEQPVLRLPCNVSSGDPRLPVLR